MQIRIVENCEQEEVVIYVRQKTAKHEQLAKLMSTHLKPSQIVLMEGYREVYINVEEILFFEAYGDKIFAHTAKKMYSCALKLYQLETAYPDILCRVSKSAVANIKQVSAFQKTFSRTGTIFFYHSEKACHVSRMYVSDIKANLNNRLLYKGE